MLTAAAPSGVNEQIFEQQCKEDEEKKVKSKTKLPIIDTLLVILFNFCSMKVSSMSVESAEVILNVSNLIFIRMLFPTVIMMTKF